MKTSEFEQIYSDYYDMVYHYALSLCRNKSVAEEITQEAFFKALRKIDEFRGDCKLEVWLCQIAKNTFFTMAKRQKRYAPIENAAEQRSEEHFDRRLEDRETAMTLYEILHSLPEPYKEVFWLRTFAELSFSEISRIFGKTENWARVTYYRAKLKLKEELE